MELRIAWAPMSADRDDEDPTRARAKARQRDVHLDRCVPDPTRLGKRVNPEPDCPHGTVGGYDNWRCQCQVVRPWHLLATENPPASLARQPGPGERPGCEPAAVAAADRRRQQRSEPPE